MTKTVSVGDVVLYHPSLDGPGFLSVVVTDPWQLGHGEWVVTLECHDIRYYDYTGKHQGRRRVCAALVEPLELVGKLPCGDHVADAGKKGE